MRILLIGENGKVRWERHRNLQDLGQVLAVDRHCADWADVPPTVQSPSQTWRIASTRSACGNVQRQNGPARARQLLSDRLVVFHHAHLCAAWNVLHTARLQEGCGFRLPMWEMEVVKVLMQLSEKMPSEKPALQ